MPLFETREAPGMQCCLISAQAIKHVPGRKSDGLDCQWIQTLHRYGLLTASFGLMLTLSPCVPSDALGPTSSSTAPRTSSLGKRRCCR
jgi:hypothetical protein